MDEPFWSKYEPVPPAELVKLKGVSCAGVTNLIRRFMKKEIPYENVAHSIGGALAYDNYLT